MELVLWRHAEAEDAGNGILDLERKLTAKGEKQARRVAQWLNDRLPDATRILVSPAVRTQQTAQALVELSDRKWKTVPAIAPGAEVDAFLAAVNWPHARHPVVAVGHQPTLGLVASRLLTGTSLPWVVKKGQIWWISSRADNGDALASLVAAIGPGQL